MPERRPAPPPARATVDERVRVVFACFAAAALLALPLVVIFPPEVWLLIGGLALVAAVIAAALLVAGPPVRDRASEQIALIWAFSCGASAFVFTGARDTCLSPSATENAILGAVAGFIAWPWFTVTRRMFERRPK